MERPTDTNSYLCKQLWYARVKSQLHKEQPKGQRVLLRAQDLLVDTVANTSTCDSSNMNKMNRNDARAIYEHHPTVALKPDTSDHFPLKLLEGESAIFMVFVCHSLQYSTVYSDRCWMNSKSRKIEM